LLTLVWDIDDVLNDFTRCWFEEWWCARNPGCMLSYHNLVSNPPHSILGIKLEEYQRSIDEFRLSALFEKMQPNPEVYEWFGQYGHFFRHIALTAVPRLAVSASAWWVFKHFGNWVRSFTFVPSQRTGEDLPVYDLSKADYLKWLNKGDVFIEDNQSNIAESKKGLKSFIVARPWNSSKIEIKELLSMLTNMRKSNGVYRVEAKGN